MTLSNSSLSGPETYSAYSSTESRDITASMWGCSGATPRDSRVSASRNMSQTMFRVSHSSPSPSVVRSSMNSLSDSSPMA